MTLKRVLDESRHIVIVGGGAVGCCAAFFLSSHPLFKREQHVITLIEASDVAGGASGKAAGCLGSWADPACLASASFRLHGELAEKFNGEKLWGFRRLASADCDAVQRHEDDADANTPVPADLGWLDPNAFRWYKPLGTTAQVHPYLFTTQMARLAQEQGVRFISGKVLEVNKGDKSEVRSVTFRDKTTFETRDILATDVVIAAGPWTNEILPQVPIGGAKSHSVVVDPQQNIEPTIIFFDAGHIGPGEDNQLEIYPRPDDTVYMSGQSDYDLKLPPTTDDVVPDLERCQKMMDTVGAVSSVISSGKVVQRQACFRPIVNVAGRDPELGPLLGPTNVKGLILAAGHNQWGIQNSPITGKVISELIFDGRAISADISALDPIPHLG